MGRRKQHWTKDDIRMEGKGLWAFWWQWCTIAWYIYNRNLKSIIIKSSSVTKTTINIKINLNSKPKRGWMNRV